jgi:glutathione reductase (NADPH)
MVTWRLASGWQNKRTLVESLDLIVIGGGSGGLATAQRAAEYGSRVMLFEPNRLGGTCVNVGCVPKKVMWNAAQLAHAMDYAPEYGFDVHRGAHDWAALTASRDRYVERLNGIYAANLERKGVAWQPEYARLDGPGEVVAAGGARYRASHIVIATGGRPRVPALPGAELGLSSDGFFELTQRPGRVAVVGSGYIAVELAGVLHALGCEVQIFARYDRILRHFEPMLAEHLSAQMRAAGIEIVTGAMPAEVRRRSAALELLTGDGRSFDGFDALIWAIGRDPNVSGLGLPEAGVVQSESGHIRVDAYQNTSTAGIYAIGDVTGQAELTPVAIAAGRRLADRLFGRHPERRLDYDLIPTVIFSHPPIGTIGLSQPEAEQRHASEGVRCYVSEFVPMFHALTSAKPRTAMKLVTVGPQQRVVGCHVIGPGADEMMQGFAVAMRMGALKSDFDDTIAIHPTSAEELVTMR